MLVSALGENVEVWIKDFDIRNHTVKSWKGGGSVILVVLIDGILAIGVQRHLRIPAR